MQKVKQTGMPYTQRTSEGKHRVYLGEFISRKEAYKVLADIQREVSTDAFVCKTEALEEPSMASKQKMQHAIVMAKARSIKEDKPKMKAIEPEEIKAPSQKIVMRKIDSRSGNTMHKEVKGKNSHSKETSKNMVCKPTKSLLREYEISQALDFYRGSSYYHFNDSRGF
jgi:hypothetical protein